MSDEVLSTYRVTVEVTSRYGNPTKWDWRDILDDCESVEVYDSILLDDGGAK